LENRSPQIIESPRSFFGVSERDPDFAPGNLQTCASDSHVFKKPLLFLEQDFKRHPSAELTKTSLRSLALEICGQGIRGARRTSHPTPDWSFGNFQLWSHATIVTA
jgi:hypothetical protein